MMRQLLVFGDLEEDEEDAILPPNLSSRPSSVTGESPSPIQGDLDLIEMCRRAAAKLSLSTSHHNRKARA